MATIHDLIEVTSISEHTTYSIDNGNLLGVVDNMVSPDLDDGEFDRGDTVFIGGVAYRIDVIQKPDSSGRFTLDDGTERSFNPASESNLDVVFLTVSNGSDVRYFIIPNDSYGDMTITSIRTGELRNAAGNDAAIISTVDNNIEILCFAAGTLITVAGRRQVPVEDLIEGDLVLTADRGLRPVRWIGRRALSRAMLHTHPHLRPIRIAPDALGPSLPEQPLYLSPQHRVLVRSKIARRMFGEAEVLVAAKHLVGLDGIEIAEGSEPVTYFHILLEQHEILFANGAACESLYLGQHSFMAFDPQERREIFEIFPELCSAPDRVLPVRTLVSGRRGRRLAERQQKNSHELVTPAAVVPQKGASEAMPC